jgi:FAD/FMN-containing dehydrogenase
VRVFLPRGWFPPVTPGTRFVTIGGCVACDVHGKNHHRDGSFGSFVERLVVEVADGREVECGPHRERELFLATVGGMGLTGLITEVTLRLQPVESGWMVVETAPVAGLAAMLDDLRDAAKDWQYTWDGSTVSPAAPPSDEASSCAAVTPAGGRPPRARPPIRAALPCP